MELAASTGTDWSSTRISASTGGEAPEILIRKLQALLGERSVASPAVRKQHGCGEGVRDGSLPAVVVFPGTTLEVAEIVRLCAAHNAPIVPYGAGTSLEGHLSGPEGCVSLSLAEMKKVVEINQEDLDCRVEAGVTREALNEELRATGLFFPLDPGANASIGGMAATRASGTNAVRYGTMREVVLGLTVVTAQGDIIRTGGRARKSSAGYDLTRLFIGSEGTLGIITEVQLRLFGIPETIAAATCQFDDLATASEVVMAAVQLGIPLARIELMDALMVEACVAFSGLQGLRPKPALVFEFHGTGQSTAEQVEQIELLCAGLGGFGFSSASTPEGRKALWKARHSAYYAARALAPGAEVFSTDACVPISRLADVITQAQELARSSGLACPIVGHVGDGNFHVFVVHQPAQRVTADRLARDIAVLAIEAGGTCTGEHGIGRHKLDLLRLEHGDAVDLMRLVKRSLDPLGLLNPGSTVPA